jgi:hypothetical protein
MLANHSFRAPGKAVVFLLLCSSLAAALFGSARAAFGRDLAVDLGMHYIHQYVGNASDNHDCGPAAVAMVLDAYGLRPAGMSDARFVASVRKATGVPNSIGTIYDDLVRVIQSYGLRYAFVPSGLPGEPDAEAQIMRQAIDDGNLVIPMVHGAVLGRGQDYEDHWVVLAGFEDDGTVHVLDPDDQPARNSGWLRGGDITLPLALFEQAGLRAQPGPYALIVYAPGKAPGLKAGDPARISGTNGDGVWLRSGPAIADNKLNLLPEGTAVTVTGPFPAPNADGHDWIGVNVNGQDGFVAADYIVGAN